MSIDNIVYVLIVFSILQWIFIFQLLHRFRLLNEQFDNMLYWHGKLVRAVGRKTLSAEDVQKWERERQLPAIEIAGM